MKARVRGFVGALAVLVFVPFAAPADATPIELGPWAANHLLCTAARCPHSTSAHGTAIVHEGNLIGFWQNILSADGYASVCTSNGIDGQYGSRSETNTKSWQAAFDLPGLAALQADGIVGPHTWTAAQQFMSFDGYDGGFTGYWTYHGAVRTIPMYYYFQELFWQRPGGLGGATYLDTDHPGISFTPC